MQIMGITIKAKPMGTDTRLKATYQTQHRKDIRLRLSRVVNPSLLTLEPRLRAIRLTISSRSRTTRPIWGTLHRHIR